MTAVLSVASAILTIANTIIDIIKKRRRKGEAKEGDEALESIGIALKIIGENVKKNEDVIITMEKRLSKVEKQIKIKRRKKITKSDINYVAWSPIRKLMSKSAKEIVGRDTIEILMEKLEKNAVRSTRNVITKI